MEYFDYSHRLYKKIEITDFSELSKTSDHPFKALIPFVLKNFSYEKFTALYRKETNKIIDEYLPISKKDTLQKKKLKEITYYDVSVNTYTWMFLFWIWHNKIDISNKDLKQLIFILMMKDLIKIFCFWGTILSDHLSRFLMMY